ncbi:MAG: hypothetical protein ABF649_17990, partial [Bacillus sp. (in: firmicutes)]
ISLSYAESDVYKIHKVKCLLNMYMSIIILASVFIWGAAINELSKSSNKQSISKIITLTSLGSLTTLVITISLFQNLSF